MSLRSEHVIECKGVTILPPAIAVVMECCSLGSLFSLLYENSASASIAQQQRNSSVQSLRSHIEMRPTVLQYPDGASVQMSMETCMMLDAARALAFIHSKGYLHCDMKSLNYLVTDVRAIHN